MENYITPMKDIYNTHHTMRISTQCRDGDWICVNCNNLNFSFRKKCNRCKIQTRQQNELCSSSSVSIHSTSSSFCSNSSIYSSYYYYPSLYPLQPHCTEQSITPFKNNLTPLQGTTPLQNNFTPLKDDKTSLNHKNNMTPKKNDIKNLPSVSPLLKKYHNRNIDQTRIDLHPWEEEQQTMPVSLFNNQNIEVNGSQVKEFSDIINNNKSIMEHDEEYNQLQFLMQKIIL